MQDFLYSRIHSIRALGFAGRFNPGKDIKSI
jgi:hypothetical protein